MRNFLLTIAFLLLSGIGVIAQNYVHIVQKDRTTSVNLNEVDSIEFVSGIWKSIGKALYTEGLITFFGTPNVTYEVEAEQDVENPSIIRLVDPYDARILPIPKRVMEKNKELIQNPEGQATLYLY